MAPHTVLPRGPGAGRGHPPDRPLRVVQLGCDRDPRLRTGAAMLEAWTALAQTARAAVAAGCEVAVVQAAWRDEEVVREGVRYRFVADARLPDRAARRMQPRLLATVRALRPDVVHVQGLGNWHLRPLYGRAAAVVMQDHSESPATGWRGAVQRWGLAQADGVMFTARAQAEPFFAAGVLRPGTPVFEVLESTTAFTPGDREAARRETGIGGDPCLLWLGHLDANKDPLTILDAVSRVRSTLPRLRLWMCHGTAPLERQVRARLQAEPELAARVTRLGRVPHVRVEQLCRAADFFVQGSRREAMGYALVESLACGATPLVTDIAAFRRVTGGGAVGGLFAPGDAEGLARLVVDFAARDRAGLRAAARAHFDAHLSPAALARELGAAYAAVARRP